MFVETINSMVNVNTAAPLTATAVLFVGLISLSWIDIRTGLLPNWLTYPMIAIGLLHTWTSMQSLWSAISGAIVGYLVIYILAGYWRRSRGRHGIGLGDAKLLAAAGSWLGVFALPVVLLIASTTGLLFVGLGYALGRSKLGMQSAIPFGPFISLGIACVWCFQFV